MFWHRSRVKKLHRKLFSLAKQYGCDIKFGQDVKSAVYEVKTKSVLIRDNKGNINTVIYIAHEMGHHISHSAGLWTGNTAGGYLNRADGAVPSVNEIDALLTEEVRAWLTAKEILKQIGFSDWVSFSRMAHRSIFSYVFMIYSEKLNNQKEERNGHNCIGNSGIDSSSNHQKHD
jgi:hypothetical protein